MKTIWVFLILLAASCDISEAPSEECVDLSKKNPAAVCPAHYKPVCGCNKITYGNECEAIREGVQNWTDGVCDCIDESKISKKPTACPEYYKPVCGCNGVTYGNTCFAEIAGVASWTEGPCNCIDESKKSIGPCTLEYAPVCGCDGVTYSTACVADRAGVTSWTQGACK